MKTNKIKAVIFDLDGTLLNTLCDLCDSTNDAMDAIGAPRRTMDEVRIIILPSESIAILSETVYACLWFAPYPEGTKTLFSTLR